MSSWMHTVFALISPLFKPTDSWRIGFFLLVILLFVAALYASRRGRSRLAVTLYAAIVVMVLLSVLSVTPRPLDQQPFPDSQEVADATQQLVNGNGYVTYVHASEPQPPRYAPGFSLALAPFAVVGDDYPSNVQRGATFYAALYVLIAVVAAWSLKGPAAGALAAIVIGMSVFARTEATLIMSDALAAAIVLLFIPLLQRPTALRISLAGALAGALVAVRLPLVVALIALILILPWPLRKRVVVFSAPFLIALGLFNWWTFGSPLRTGYDYWLPNLREFSLSFALVAPMRGDGPWVVADILDGGLLRWVCPCPPGGPQAALRNLFFYPAILLGLFWIYVPPLVPIIGVLYGWEKRRELAVRFAFWVTVLSLLIFTFYFWQGARFMAAPATLLGVFASAKIVEWTERWVGLRSR